MVRGMQAGTDLVTAPGITAVGFTGSQRGGLALWRLANEREIVIPVYAEMGTVNPAVLTPAGAAARAEEVAAGFVGSFTLGSGQFCTKPGLLLAPAGHDLPAAVEIAPDGGGVYRSVAFPGLWINVRAVFADDLSGMLSTLDAGLATPEHAAFTAKLAAAKTA